MAAQTPTPQQAREHLAMHIRNLVSIAIEDAESGMYDPSDAKAIEADYRQAKMDLREYLDLIYPGTHRAEGQDF